MYIKRSISRPQGNPGVGLRVRDSISLLDVDDILHMPDRDDKGVVIVENIVMKPNCYSEDIYLTSGSGALTSNAEGDTDQTGFQPQFEFTHPGNSREVREFKANSINRRFIAIIRHCDGSPADIIGSLCNPCKVVPSYTGNNESNSNKFTVQQIMRGEDIGIYEGTIPSAEPVGTVTDTTINYVADGQYKVADGAGAINQISGGAHGAIVTILGASGVNATVVSTGEGSNIMLKNGSTLVASEGSQITLRAFKDSDAGLKWIEVSRFVA